MSDSLVFPRAREVGGTVRIPPSKSATNRALLLAALGSEPVDIVRPLESDDISTLERCLAAMGAELSGGRQTLRVRGPLSAPANTETLVDARDSGTAARFLAAVCSAVPGRFRLDGSARLRERPMAELISSLRSAGAEISCPGREGFLPLAIRGATLRSGPVEVEASRSSQFASALMLAAVAVPGGLSVRISGAPVSTPYVEATREALTAFGHRVRHEAGVTRVERGALPPGGYEVPGDHSSAMPLLAAAGAAGGRVTVLGISRRSSAADARALPLLEEMGIAVEDVDGGVAASAVRGSLRSVSADAGDFPDAVPVLAALAALARGESVLSGIGHLRGKESDRIEALSALLHAAGVRARSEPAALAVVGGPDEPGGAATLPTCRDHRIAMAAALLAISRGGFLIEDPGCVSKSYPGFFRDLASLLK